MGWTSFGFSASGQNNGRGDNVRNMITLKRREVLKILKNRGFTKLSQLKRSCRYYEKFFHGGGRRTAKLQVAVFIG